MFKNKCKGCVYRKVGCHANCDDYISYIKQLNRCKNLKKEDALYYRYKGAHLDSIYNEPKVKRKFINR